ncbi:uncharacterized protein CcaverHIS019_0402980 [Cutaneotrichosporon cavernicola]|uniref:Cation/H+ exchanger transmembrane domain-containing protein n=1 Tax=Cutaneotrichosporon cavernicola TaxID=279322 RepID=A0AA48L3X7_9TREE|nr:uncharacterized protein CcaverHIS019_0402980 [Cutaneotrichosporon cavernicola]BEI91478.1 hypothetical protein CcaverHIS019_0402980 [Cutaneotrichosporon cavernicola]BEI99253.1 hypothetical protein CcaverHIS631_0402960 [Cutaneotrichosporon cavernicola]BEJ07030.1 hypothetical protein CcaverHIS641_0402990 [Cutaneotrichosporon cavernicola]
MVKLDINETSQSLAIFGGYLVFFGLVSFYFKERLYMSEALMAFLVGIAFGPIGAGVFSPIDWVHGDEHQLDYVTYQISRIVMGLQVLFTGLNLPMKYIWRQKHSLSILLLPVMTTAWFTVGLLVWGLIPGMTFCEALVIGSCVTPTDPVLANSICKGRFAEKYVPLGVRNIILAEAGANDGLGFPFLFIPLLLILRYEPGNVVSTVGGAIGQWFYDIVVYQIIVSVVLGIVIGYVARKALLYAEKHHYIEHESYLAFCVAITFLTLGIVGILGSDDILSCFVVGNVMNWDDSYREGSEGQAFQEVIDCLLNSGIFLFIGAIMPWDQFGNFWSITPWRLVVLGICVMLVRRLPWVWMLALFAGYFGPIGVGALFYAQVALHWVPHDARPRLYAMVLPVVYFIIMTSIIVHGITIPLGMLLQRLFGFDPSKLFSGGHADLLDAKSLRGVPPVSALPQLPIHSNTSAQTIECTATKAVDDSLLHVPGKPGSVSQSNMSHMEGSETTYEQDHVRGWGRTSNVSGRSTPDLGHHGHGTWHV